MLYTIAGRAFYANDVVAAAAVVGVDRAHHMHKLVLVEIHTQENTGSDN